MRTRFTVRRLLSTLAAAALLAASASHAAAVFKVLVDTAALIGHPAGPFYIEFQLNDGSGTGNANNIVGIDSFDFSGGAAVGVPLLFGGAGGDLGGAVEIEDSDFLNEFIQEFLPGSLLSFEVELSTVVEAGPQPDQFSFAILDCNLVEIPTRGPADALVLADIAVPLVPRAYASDLNRSSACAGGPIDVQASIVAEPGSLLLAAIAVMAAGAVRRGRALGVGSVVSLCG